MKILHCCLSAFYIDNAQYQENILPIINKEDGHEVQIIASTEVFVDGNTLGLCSPGDYFTEEGIRIIRLPYKKIINSFISKKFRAYPDLYKHIEAFKPDVILFHGAAAWALNTVVKYKKRHPRVKLFVDSHEDKNNSSRNILSRVVLYDLFYSPILRKNMRYIDKLLYITKETKDFINEVYHINDSKLEFFPLGGLIPSDEVYEETRRRIRADLNLSDNDFLCVHSGKLDKDKRSLEIVDAFSKFENKNFKLLIIGRIAQEIEEQLKSAISNDERIIFAGWKSSEDLQEYLMAADLYIQLGSQSVTMQQALCNRVVAAVFPFESHRYLLEDKVYYISDEKELYDLLMRISENSEEFSKKRAESIHLSKSKLDYREIIKTIYR